jgi:hypothetical protein
MKIVINHLTRMTPGYICVAGIDTHTRQHVRPVLAGRRLDRNLLLPSGGLFDMGSVVELGAVRRIGAPPDVEDYAFDPRAARHQRVMNRDEFWTILRRCARKKLTTIFGDDLTPRGSGCTVDIGRGTASLGCLVPAAPPTIYIDGFNKVRASVADGACTVDLSVTDLRLFEDDQKTPRTKTVDRTGRRIRAGVSIILSVGLARAWQKPGDTERRHWLQVNNIHLEDDPVWRLK